MLCRSFRVALLIGVVAAATATSVRANGHCAPASSPGATTKVAVCELVPETYKVKRTVYKYVPKEEVYTAYRCESVPEVRTRTVTYHKLVHENQTVTRDVCVKVPVWEDRCVMKKCWETVRVCEMQERRRLHTYWECCEVPCYFSNFCERLSGCGNSCHNGCNNACHNGCRTRTVRRLRCCWVTECVPVTRCKRVCVERPVTCRVCTYKTEIRKETCNVTVCKCVPETRTETYTCYVCKQVPVQCKRTVCVCQPVEEEVTCTRYVCRTVYRDAPVCHDCCRPCCERRCGGFFGGGCRRHGCNNCYNGCCH